MSCRGVHGPMNMYRNFGFQVRELRRKHKGGVQDDKVSDEKDENVFEPTQEGLKDGRANVSRNEIRPTFDFEALDIAGDSFCKLREFLLICVYTFWQFNSVLCEFIQSIVFYHTRSPIR